MFRAFISLSVTHSLTLLASHVTAADRFVLTKFNFIRCLFGAHLERNYILVLLPLGEKNNYIEGR